MSLIALFFVVGILMVLRHIFHKNNGRITFQAGLGSHLLFYLMMDCSEVINALIVELLNTLFTSLANWLTDALQLISQSFVASALRAIAPSVSWTSPPPSFDVTTTAAGRVHAHFPRLRMYFTTELGTRHGGTSWEPLDSRL